MFLCKDCVKPDDRVRILRSYGPCEDCGKVDSCYDVNIHYTSDRNCLT